MSDVSFLQYFDTGNVTYEKRTPLICGMQCIRKCNANRNRKGVRFSYVSFNVGAVPHSSVCSE
jgi:hypothetical protein